MKLFSILSIMISRVRSFSLRTKIILGIIILLLLGWGVRSIILSRASSTPIYETSEVTKGTLTTTITGTGTITTGNTTSITTGATGTVTTVYVKNGDTVSKGDKIAELTLDQYGLKRQAAAYLSYTNAQEAVKTAEADKIEADIAMWNWRQDILDAEDAIYQKNKDPNYNPTTKKAYTLSEATVIDKTLEVAQKSFAEAELKYKNAGAEIANASVRSTSAWYDYQQVSSTILAPSDGMVQNLTLSPGTTISNSSDSSISISDGTTTSSNSSTNTLTASSQSIGTIRSSTGQFKATVSLTEVDIPNIQADQKVTMTMDAFPDNSFTGKVLAVDTSGTVSSGVTSYSVMILLDQTSVNIYPKMAVNATIITSVKSDVLLIPTSAITTVNDTSTVQIMKNNTVSTVTVTVGIANDTQTEVKTGLSAGDAVIISTTTTQDTTAAGNSSSGTRSTSIFGGMGRIGGGEIRVGGPDGR